MILGQKQRVLAEHKGYMADKTAFCAVQLMFCPGNILRHISMLSDLFFFNL